MIQNNARHLPVDIDAEDSMIESHIPVDIDLISELASALKLEESRSASYRRSWLKDRKRSRSSQLKLLILTNDTRQMVFENTFRDRQSSPLRINTIDGFETAIKIEKIWSAFFFKGWMKERSHRQRLELQLASMF